MPNPMRDYLAQREKVLEARVVGLEALLCDSGNEVRRLEAGVASLRTMLKVVGFKPRQGGR